MNFGIFEDAIWYLNIAAAIALLAVLVLQGLLRIYPLLGCYVAVDVLQQLLGVLFLRTVFRSPLAYFYVYTVGQTLKLLLSVFVVLNLSKEALRAHPALARFSRSASAYVLAGAALLAALALVWVPPAMTAGAIRELRYFLAFERSMDLAMLLLLLSLAAFLLWFPVKMNTNVAYYVGGLSVYFLARWMGALADNATFDWRRAVSMAQLTLSFLGLAAMALNMRSAGERSTVILGHRWSPSEMERLAGQLDALNAALGRESRKVS